MSETKSPSGNYPAHSQAHFLDLDEVADRLLQKLPGHSRQTETLAREGGVSLLVMAMDAGDELNEHKAKGAVTVQLLRGHALLTAAGQEFDLREGQLVFMQPAVSHSVRAEAQSVIVLTVTGGEDH